ncbi:divalent-cation tolerance protein CutA [Noviluteimonas gilva]|uniref:Divalent cation tolerance protein CutA n=1 Tax=Noviluteimonas gilva TaxID=2682097 RepID=A0A7C9HTD8_9GAMM|nr:divalent cation tolerance protein CutA [Lysobacter gilvus]
MTALLCLTTCPDFDTAQRIANALVEARLAACVNFVPGMHSTYRWQGKVEHAGEVLLLVKTTRVRMPAVQERIVALHPYELPEVLTIEAGGLPAYLQWIAQETDPSAQD